MIRRCKILCIGVNHVPGSGFKPLSYAEKNAADAAKYFKTLSNTKVLPLTGKEATKTKILKWLNRMDTEPGRPGQENAKEETTVILFFSGHASATKDKSKGEWERGLWVHGEPGNHLETHCLKMPEILKSSSNPFQRLMVIIDACYHIGGKQPVRSIFEEFKNSERFTSLKPYTIISSSTLKQHLFEDPALERGVLTHYLLKTLAGRYTFFVKKKIAIFKFLQILEDKVKSHRFSTTTGRKRLVPILMKNGVIAHSSGKNFQFPILEPTPLIIDPDKHFLKRKATQLAHFFTRTRVISRISLAGSILGILLLILYLAAGTMVRIHSNSPRQALFQENLLKQQRYSLDKLGTRHMGKDRYQDVNIYLFKHNWVKAFLEKLDETGKIIIRGNLLGHRLNGIPVSKILGYALENNHDVFYWHPDDVMKLLENMRGAYGIFNNNQKQKALELLAKLGKKGKHIAQWVITFTKESDQNLRNLFLQHFYSPDFVKKNPDFLNIYDYLYLTKNKKEIPPEIDLRLRKETKTYLQTAADSIPDPINHIADKTELSKIYKKLEILALWGSHRFREKASAVFKQAFDPDEICGLFWDCRNLKDKLWLLELYFKKTDIYSPGLMGEQLVYRYIPNCATNEERSAVLEIIMDNNLELIPKKYRNNLLNYLRYLDPRSVSLTDWENWVQRYSLDSRHVFYVIIDKDYKEIFSFLKKHYEYFKDKFNGAVFDRLYRFDKTKTIDLAKKIFAIGKAKDRLHAAVFLYNKNYPVYSEFILEFLEKAGKNIRYRRILQEFYGAIEDVVIRLMSKDNDLKKNLKSLLHQPDLFYRFFKTNMQLWPNGTTREFLTAEIPGRYIDGYPFLKKCEQLPGIYRKKMLIKIIDADIDSYFKSKVEAALAKHYPREFLELVFKANYNWNRYTRRNIVSAHQAFSNEVLKKELILNLKRGHYRRVDFICEALVGKKQGELNTREIQSILAEFDRPPERIVLRELRYYLQQRQFLEVE